jgi:hypothetical protein
MVLLPYLILEMPWNTVKFLVYIGVRQLIFDPCRFTTEGFLIHADNLPLVTREHVL